MAISNYRWNAKMLLPDIEIEFRKQTEGRRRRLVIVISWGFRLWAFFFPPFLFCFFNQPHYAKNMASIRLEVFRIWQQQTDRRHSAAWLR